MTFRVHGNPAPQGSKRHVGHGVMIESSKLVKPWREAVKFAAFEAEEHPYLRRHDGPLSVQLHFTLAQPASLPKSKARLGPCRKPDLDKLVRSTLDGLVEAGVIADDARVVTMHATKRYPDESEPSPGCTVIIEEIKP